MKVDLQTLNWSHYQPWLKNRGWNLQTVRLDVAIRPIGRKETRQILSFDLWLETHCTFQIGRRSSRYHPVRLSDLGGKLDPILDQQLRDIFESSWQSIKV